MKSVTHVFLVVVAFLALASLAFRPLSPAHAVPATQIVHQETQPADAGNVDDLVTSAKNLAGIAALVAVLINFGKKVGVVKEGRAGAWSTGINLLLLGGIFAAQLTGNANLIPAIDAQAGQLATVATGVLAYIYQLWVSSVTHDNVLSGLPLIGKTFS